MTLLYELWYDMVLGGTYTKEIRKMHETYGPVVRISPDELHCNDAAFVDEIYAAAGRKRNKQAHNPHVLAGPTTNSAFGTIVHDQHRVRRYFPWVRGLVHVAPFLAKYMTGDIGILMKEMYINTPNRIRQAREDHVAGRSEKTVDRLSGEGFSLTGAGTETTAWTLSVITFYVLSQPAIQARLAEELKDTDPESLSWTTLEKLPHLSAVISEGLRLSYGVSSRTSRVPRDEHLVYTGEVKGRGAVEYVIPKGTAIGMSAAIMHHNEEVFPNSDAFILERWLDEKGLKRPNILAYCELYMTTAALALRVFPHMKLHGTMVEDVKYDHDLITAQAKKGSKGVQVVMC
ncbi:Uu.00g056600.m01.CDS01 [Anthostomella pinea]|uniref:Uu.00g056600.m01.CDS01 n=1 Tax=Anthostomella pinea TaxID=933095 RepID=A0AAI8VKZ6_9PEZI|nr:Uu.00g056600.m01.CDS01 [Anthostomella pinea]